MRSSPTSALPLRPVSAPSDSDGAQSTGAKKAQSLWAAFDDAVEDEGFHIDGYEILGELGRGGMGVIYHARQDEPSREVALKVMLPKLASDPEMRRRFQTEAQAMAVLDHPGILPIYEVGECDGMPFFSMKMAAGGSMAEKLLKGTVAPKPAVDQILGVARAVHHAHQHGVLHRDLKPGNFLYDGDGKIYVSDFGVAKLQLDMESSFAVTRTNAFVGTPFYLAPEVVDGSSAETTIAGDIYALGAVLYEVLLGRRPHDEKTNVAALMRSIVDDPIEPPRSIDPAIPLDLAVICMKALSKNPADRYLSMADMAADLQRWKDGDPIHAREISLRERTVRLVKKHPFPSFLIMALIGLSIAGGLAIAYSNVQLAKANDAASDRLHTALIAQAHAERLLTEPGYRSRAMDLLRQANELGTTREVGTAAIAVLAGPDFEKLRPEVARRLPASPYRDPHLSGNFRMAFGRDGTARLMKVGQTLRQWEAAPGQTIFATFAQKGRVLIVTGTSEGSLLLSGEDYSLVQRLPIGDRVLFLGVDPEGEFASFGMTTGVMVYDLAAKAQLWRDASGVVRCPPEWAKDSESLLVVAGATKTVVEYDRATGRENYEITLPAWPEQIVAAPDGGIVAVALENENIAIIERDQQRRLCLLEGDGGELSFSKKGQYLKSSKGAAWEVLAPIGYHEWTGARSEAESPTVYSAKLSGDGRFLLVTTTSQVEIWRLSDRELTDSYAVENQRIDARTDAWWLPHRSRQMLVQVPGGLELLNISPAGRIVLVENYGRVPGTVIHDILANGEWLMRVMDEDGNISREVWPDGSEEKSRELEGDFPISDKLIAAVSGTTAHVGSQGAITVEGAWKAELIPPSSINILQLLLTESGERIIGVTEDHRIFEWDLPETQQALQSEDFLLEN